MGEILDIEVTLKDKFSPGMTGIGKSIAGGLAGLAAGALAVGAAAATAAAVGLGSALNLSLQEAMDNEQAQAQLSAALASTGSAAGMTMESLNALAGGIQDVTRFSDDEVLAAESLLLTFTKIGKDVFPDATMALADMATRMGGDMSGSAIQLGKALNDPIAGISALTRVGVVFTQSQKDAIKAMVEAGDVAGAQKVILAELNTEFGGSAKAAGQTFAGQLDILRNSLLNVAEGVGTKLLPILTDAFKKITPLIQEWAEKLANFMSSEEFSTWLTDTAAYVVDTLVPAIIDISKWLGTNLPVAAKAIAEFWRNDLMPAWREAKPILDELLPVLGSLLRFLGETLPPVMSAFAKGWVLMIAPVRIVVGTVTDAIAGLQGTIEKLTNLGFLGWLKEVALGFGEMGKRIMELVLPDWLVPGSPTPLEMGIRGIAGAAQELTGGGLAGFNQSFAGAGAAGIGGNTVVINFNSPVVGFADKYALASELGPIIKSYLAGKA